MARPRSSEYLSPAQAADLLTQRGYPISAQTLRRLCAAGKLEHVTTPGGQHRIRKVTVEQFLSSKLYKPST